ncbi:MAG: hypothetical protein IPP02_07045 [Chitinophagaceae bacterium]|nr:hypothetical protein [Chitinophagaceae bacterium]
MQVLIELELIMEQQDKVMLQQMLELLWILLILVELVHQLCQEQELWRQEEEELDSERNT